MQPRRENDYDEFVAASWNRMVRYAHVLTGNRSDAEDAVQSAYIKAYASWRRVQRATYPEAYVRRIVTNEISSGWRRRWRHVERTTSELPELATPGHDESVVNAELLWHILQRLSPRQRAVIVLRYYEDLSEREIAETLGISAGTVKSRASAALKAIREHLDATGISASALLEGNHS